MAQTEPGTTLGGKVLGARSGFADVETADGVYRCRFRGKAKRRRWRTDLCVAGDDVELTLRSDGTGIVEQVHPRRTRFSRRHPGPGGRWQEDVLVANLDQVVCVFCFDRPAFNPRMLDRALVIAEANGVDAVVVANKHDLARADDEREAFRIYTQIGYPVVWTSAEDGTGIDELREWLPDRVSAFTGPSGAGKSRLINAVEPGLELRVGDVSTAVGKGRHTTRVAWLHPLRVGGYVADTPGIRELGTWRLPPEDLDRCFPEMRPYLGHCAFGDCFHVHEPECGVRAARDEGRVPASRYESYVRLLDDARESMPNSR